MSGWTLGSNTLTCLDPIARRSFCLVCASTMRPHATCGLSGLLLRNSSRPCTAALWLMTLTMTIRTLRRGATPQRRIFSTNCLSHGCVMSGSDIRCLMVRVAISALRGASSAHVAPQRPKSGLSVRFPSVRPIVGISHAHVDQTFMELPDASKINFIDSPGVHLSTLLPHLDAPPQHGKEVHFPPADQEQTVADLLQRLLIYPPYLRLKAVEALRHPWLLGDGPLVLPRSALASDNVLPYAAEMRDGRTAGEWLKVFLVPGLQ